MVRLICSHSSLQVKFVRFDYGTEIALHTFVSVCKPAVRLRSGVAMKHSTKAALFSLVIPGAGLWYCRRRGLAVANFLLAAAVPIVGFAMGFLSEHIQWVFLAIASGSAGLAHAMSGYRPDKEETVQ